MMRTFAILLIVVLMASCKPKVQQDQVLASLDKETLLPALFKAPVNNGWCVWKPGTTKEDSMNVSEDGLCHTRIDTILYYTEGGNQKAVALIGTWEWEGGSPVWCHACNPFLSIAVSEKLPDNRWRIVLFKKNMGAHGTWSELPEFDIVQLGTRFFLAEYFEYSGQGIDQTWNTYYCLPTLVESIETQSMDDSGFRQDAREMSVWSDSLFDASEGNITKVLVKTEGFSFDEKMGSVSMDSSKLYVLDDSGVFRRATK